MNQMDRMIVDADKSWVVDLEHVAHYGDHVSPRGMVVFESLAVKSVVSMENPIIFNPLRKLGYKFMAAEAAWILSGDDQVSTIAPYSKDIANFSDDGVSFFGAYGPKIAFQVDYVVSTLYNDVFSRQAVINIWRESPRQSKDIPCTLSLQFLIRLGRLECVATMRSSDLWLGHPYDIFSFSAVSFYVMLQLNKIRIKNGEGPIRLGNLHLTAGSKHIYHKNIDDVEKIITAHHEGFVSPIERTPAFISERYSINNPQDFISHLWECADSKGGAFNLMFES